MSDPPFCQSTGQGDLPFWEIKEGPTLVTWERAYDNKKRQVGWKRQTPRKTRHASCGTGQKKRRMKSGHGLSSAKIKDLTASEDHASCWVHKVLTVMILETNSGFVDKSKGVGWKGLDSECQVRLTGIKREYWMDIDSDSIHIYRAVYEVHMHIYVLGYR